MRDPGLAIGAGGLDGPTEAGETVAVAAFGVLVAVAQHGAAFG